jgi:hypothetical protein
LCAAVACVERAMFYAFQAMQCVHCKQQCIRLLVYEVLVQQRDHDAHKHVTFGLSEQ